MGRKGGFIDLQYNNLNDDINGKSEHLQQVYLLIGSFVDNLYAIKAIVTWLILMVFTIDVTAST